MGRKSASALWSGIWNPTHIASWLILTKTSCLTPSSSKMANASASTFSTLPTVASGGRVEECWCSSA